MGNKVRKIDSFRDEYWFLSNFWPCILYHAGIRYPSVEHAFQAQKTMSYSKRLQISKLETPDYARKAGRRLKLREDWEKCKEAIMFHLLKQKFKDPKLNKQLADTSDAELIEGNWWGDTYWGVCNGKGENRLGKLLMKVRDELGR